MIQDVIDLMEQINMNKDQVGGFCMKDATTTGLLKYALAKFIHTNNPTK